MDSATEDLGALTEHTRQALADDPRLGQLDVCITLRGQRALYVEAMRGIGAFVDDLQRARPGLPVRLGSRARRLEGRFAS